jgi:hypothetical protein
MTDNEKRAHARAFIIEDARNDDFVDMLLRYRAMIEDPLKASIENNTLLIHWLSERREMASLYIQNFSASTEILMSILNLLIDNSMLDAEGITDVRLKVDDTYSIIMSKVNKYRYTDHYPHAPSINNTTND